MEFLNHDLAHEFPDMVGKMRQLKQHDAHFAKLFHQYDEANHAVLKLEGENIPVMDEAFEALKKTRLRVKDEIYQYLLKA